MREQYQRTNYKEFIENDGLTKLEGWVRDGLTDAQVANNIGVNPRQIYRWRKTHPEFDKIMKRSKAVVDVQVENALLKRALGYDVTEYFVDADGNRKEVQKQMPPDVTAQIFWLKNRKPQEWRDRRDVAVEGKLPVVLKGDDDIAD